MSRRLRRALLPCTLEKKIGSSSLWYTQIDTLFYEILLNSIIKILIYSRSFPCQLNSQTIEYNLNG